MNARNLVYVLAILFATAAISADNKGSGTISGTVNGAEIGTGGPKAERQGPAAAARDLPESMCVE